MPEDKEESEEQKEESDKNIDSKEKLPASQDELKQSNKNNPDQKPNNAQTDEKNAVCELAENDQEEEQQQQDNSEANSIQDKVSQISKGKLGDQKSENLERIDQDSRKKVGRRDEKRQVTEEKDRLVEEFNLIEIDEKTCEKENGGEDEEEAENEGGQKDLRHVKEGEEKCDNQVYDAATDEQKKEKKKEDEIEENLKDEFEKSSKSLKKDESSETQKDDTDVVMDPVKLNELNPVKKNEVNAALDADDTIVKEEEEEDAMDVVEVDEDEVECDVKDSFFVCLKENLLGYTTTREEVELNLASFRELDSSADNEVEVSLASLKLWQDYESLTQQMSKELCEQLRLILEPTVCSKLKGDYKSGKRLNMKRVIEYIATEYRKDKIWLRRIKPNKRDYQVMLAIDNSSSMGDNRCIQLAYETIATLMNAFNYLEVGQLGLLKFGEKVTQLHDLQTNFHTDDGARIISQIDFRDETTKVAEMLGVSTEVFRCAGGRVNRGLVGGGGSISKLLVILSDGRGIFYEGIETVRLAIKKAMQEQIFIVFVLLETPRNKSSIFDIKMPIFENGVGFILDFILKIDFFNNF